MKQSLDVKDLVAIVIPGNWGLFPHGWVEKEKELLGNLGIKSIGTGHMPDPIFARSYTWFEYIKKELKGAGVFNKFYNCKWAILIGESTGSLAAMKCAETDQGRILGLVLMNTYPSPQSVKPKFPLSLLRPLLVKVEKIGSYFPLKYKSIRKVPIINIAASWEDELINHNKSLKMRNNLLPRTCVDDNIFSFTWYEGGHSSISKMYLEDLNRTLVYSLKKYGVTGLP